MHPESQNFPMDASAVVSFGTMRAETASSDSRSLSIGSIVECVDWRLDQSDLKIMIGFAGLVGNPKSFWMK